MALTHLSFDATFYITERPDVLTAYINGGSEAGTGMSWAQFAEQHYNDFGWKEGYNPNAIFDTSEYLAANLDVLNAGVNPFQHYLQFGAYEKRAPSNSFISFEDFDWETYLAANSDLAEAGIETAEEAYGHFVVYGQFESRPGTPEQANPGDIFTLTTGLDQFVGTDANDTFRAIDSATLQSIDILDGGAGNDVLNISAGAIAGNAAPVIGNIETINNAHLGATLNLGTVTGVQQIWTDGAGSTVTSVTRYNDASLSTTFGVKGSVGGEKAVHMTFADSVEGDDTTVNLALEGNKASSFTQFEFDDGGIENVVISVADGNEGRVHVGGGVENITVAGDGDFGYITFGVANTLKVLDASGVNGNVTIGWSTGDDANGFAQDGAVFTTGAGNDSINLSNSTGDLTIDGGAGNDTIKGGAGNDTIIGGSGQNTLWGNGGADLFVIEGDTTAQADLSSIQDFDGVEGDTISFGLADGDVDNFFSLGLDASYINALTNANTAFTSDSDLLYVFATNGTDGYLFVNGDGDGSADFAVALVGVTTFDASDIVSGAAVA